MIVVPVSLSGVTPGASIHSAVRGLSEEAPVAVPRTVQPTPRIWIRISFTSTLLVVCLDLGLEYDN